MSNDQAKSGLQDAAVDPAGKPTESESGPPSAAQGPPAPKNAHSDSKQKQYDLLEKYDLPGHLLSVLSFSFSLVLAVFGLFVIVVALWLTPNTKTSTEILALNSSISELGHSIDKVGMITDLLMVELDHREPVKDAQEPERSNVFHLKVQPEVFGLKVQLWSAPGKEDEIDKPKSALKVIKTQLEKTKNETQKAIKDAAISSPVDATQTWIVLVGGTIIEAFAFLCFVQSNRARTRVMSEFFERLREDRRLDEALSLTHNISIPNLKDQMQAVLSASFSKSEVSENFRKLLTGEVEKKPVTRRRGKP